MKPHIILSSCGKIKDLNPWVKLKMQVQYCSTRIPMAQTMTHCTLIHIHVLVHVLVCFFLCQSLELLLMLTATAPCMVTASITLQPATYSIHHINPYVTFLLHVYGAELHESYGFQAGQ